MPVPGYHGRYLVVTLAEVSRSHHVPLSEETLRHYLGGAGLGAHLLLQLNAANEDAIDAPIAFVFSSLVGSPLTTSAKFAVVCKSPLTDRFNDALASSGFAISGKATGADAIVITEKAKEPSVLVVDDGVVRLEPAADLWGLSTTAAEAKLKIRYGADFDFAVIGPAAEKLVRYASLSHDGRHAGRGGSGAVLGGKRIKAIAVRGTQRCSWHDPGGLVGYAKTLSEKSFGPATAKYRELGTLLTFWHSIDCTRCQRGTSNKRPSNPLN